MIAITAWALSTTARIRWRAPRPRGAWSEASSSHSTRGSIRWLVRCSPSALSLPGVRTTRGRRCRVFIDTGSRAAGWSARKAHTIRSRNRVSREKTSEIRANTPIAKSSRPVSKASATRGSRVRICTWMPGASVLSRATSRGISTSPV